MFYIQLVNRISYIYQLTLKKTCLFTTKNEGQEYKNTQTQCGEEAQKDTIRLIDRNERLFVCLTIESL